MFCYSQAAASGLDAARRSPNLPVDVSVQNVNKALASTPSGSFVVVFPKAGHDLRDVPSPGEPWSFEKFAPGYLDLVTSWVKAESASSILPAPIVTH